MAQRRCGAPAAAALLLLVLALLSPPASCHAERPPIATGVIDLTHHHGVQPRGSVAGGDCAASAAADLQERLALPQWDPAWAPTTFEDRRLGPYLRTYPPVSPNQIPARCEAQAWARQRLLAAADASIALGLNYCHFHAPGYEAPPETRAVCVQLERHSSSGTSRSSSSSANSSASTTASAGPGSVNASASGAGSSSEPCVWMRTSICNDEGMGNKAAHPWRGMDCSNFVAWVFNLAFGYYATTHIGEAACHPTRAPGRLLHTVTTDRLHELLPGDLVFGRLSRRRQQQRQQQQQRQRRHDSGGGAAAAAAPSSLRPSAVRHVSLWTGRTVDWADASSPLYNTTLLGNLPPSQRAAHVRCMRQQLAAGRPVYVVADSTYAGPAYRPFCGPYLHNFSHARRIIAEPRQPGSASSAGWPHRNHPRVAHFDAATRECMSWWRLAPPQPHDVPQHYTYRGTDGGGGGGAAAGGSGGGLSGAGGRSWAGSLRDSQPAGAPPGRAGALQARRPHHGSAARHSWHAGSRQQLADRQPLPRIVGEGAS